MENSITPPMAFRSRSSSISSFDESYIEFYLSKTYIPLSNLPTPPLSSHSNSTTRQQSPEAFLAAGEILDPDLLGPAVHLTNLIPSSTSLTSPSVPLVHSILTKAHLPLETIALAVCILDSLNSRFALSWRSGCPLITPSPRTLFGGYGQRAGEQHIDSIHPELIILSALILAVKFLDDAQQPTKEYAGDWGKGLWSWNQINFTQRRIMENLGYRLLPLWDETIILEALEDMERAGRQSSPEFRTDEDWDTDTCFGSFGGDSNELKTSMSTGRAQIGMGQSLTPAETPLVENIRGTRELSPETRRAFFTGTGAGEHQELRLPTRTRGGRNEHFPACADSMDGLDFGR